MEANDIVGLPIWVFDTGQSREIGINIEKGRWNFR
jgi:hypothetical protein